MATPTEASLEIIGARTLRNMRPRLHRWSLKVSNKRSEKSKRALTIRDPPDHPYPGNVSHNSSRLIPSQLISDGAVYLPFFPVQFPPITNSASILEQVCQGAQRGLGLPIPYVITEMSLYTGVKSASFETTFYESQLATWAWSGGET